MGAWAAGYFDAGQALWQLTPGRSAFGSWRAFASQDLTPEITGLHGFAADVAAAPEEASAALAAACDALGVGPDVARDILPSAPRAARRLGAVSDGYSSGRPNWRRGRTRRPPTCWRSGWSGKQALLEQYEDPRSKRGGSRSAPRTPRRRSRVRRRSSTTLLQEAAERAAQRALAVSLVGERRRARPRDGRCCRRRSASTCARRCSAGRWKRWTRASRHSALRVSSG